MEVAAAGRKIGTADWDSNVKSHQFARGTRPNRSVALANSIPKTDQTSGVDWHSELNNRKAKFEHGVESDIATENDQNRKHNNGDNHKKNQW